MKDDDDDRETVDMHVRNQRAVNKVSATMFAHTTQCLSKAREYFVAGYVSSWCQSHEVLVADGTITCKEQLAKVHVASSLFVFMAR